MKNKEGKNVETLSSWELTEIIIMLRRKQGNETSVSHNTIREILRHRLSEDISLNMIMESAEEYKKNTYTTTLIVNKDQIRRALQNSHYSLFGLFEYLSIPRTNNISNIGSDKIEKKISTYDLVILVNKIRRINNNYTILSHSSVVRSINKIFKKEISNNKLESRIYTKLVTKPVYYFYLTKKDLIRYVNATTSIPKEVIEYL